MKVTGSLRLKRGIWQLQFDYQDAAGQRKQKSESTGLPEKGNKRRAQKLLETRLTEMEQQYEAALDDRNVQFLSFMRSWLDDVVVHTVRKHHANIRKCLEYAVRLGILTQNPASIVELPPKQKYKGATAYTPEQLKALLNIFQDDPLETVVHLAVTYGIPPSKSLVKPAKPYSGSYLR